MYDIRQFKPTLYLLILMGMTGFALAADTPGLWLFAVGALVINVWLIKSRRFTPMPRWLANVLGVLALVLAGAQIRAGDNTPIITIGEFLILFHLIKLFEQRANRDFAQLLVLSFLLMVAAAVSTASLLFGLMFVAYLFVSLYCCLLFHVKIETDKARAEYGLPIEEINSPTLRQDQRYLTRSMLRLTGLVSIFAVGFAVVVFLFFPRGMGAGLIGQPPLRPAQALTGFSDEMGFQKIAQIEQDFDVVARVELYRGDKKVTDQEFLYLRGNALDSYSGNSQSPLGRWKWYRSESTDQEQTYPSPDNPVGFFTPGGHDVVTRQQVTLQPTGTAALFAMGGACQFEPTRPMHIIYSPHTGIIHDTDVLMQPIQYNVWSTDDLGEIYDGDDGWRAAARTIDPQIKQYAMKPEVCGVDANGQPLALLPLTGDDPIYHTADGEIADNIEKHLRGPGFAYTLDLTDAGNIGDSDPVVAFLYNFKRGHCEYFASAMALMCQSINIPARVVNGFACSIDDYNRLGDYFEVKQSNAHAWCEVCIDGHWKRYDPTSSNDVGDTRQKGLVAEVKNVFDYLEYKWATNVVAYDGGERKNLITNMDNSLTRSANTIVNGNSFGWQRKLSDWWEGWKWNISMAIAAIALVVVSIVLLAAIAWFLIERWRLRRRARRIGLGELNTTDQLRLVRQLGFYDDLVQILERHDVVRPGHLTPMEFSGTLTFLPGQAYEDIRRLTQLFYRVRYGAVEINAHRQRRLETVVQRIAKMLDVPGISKMAGA
jgi:Ca2+/Na+ antiporter